jgi:hypothetical protein
MPESALTEESSDLANYIVEAGNGTERVERRAVGGVFPRQ